MAKLDKIDLNPQPQVWPACAECKEPFVLRRVLVLREPTPDNLRALKFEWAWQRDCKHKKAEAITQVAKPEKQRKVRR